MVHMLWKELCSVTLGLLRVELFIPEADSLKLRRCVLRSIKDRLRRFNISLAEEPGNLWQRTTLYAACVSFDKGHANGILEGVKNSIERAVMVEILDYSIELE